MIGVQKERFQHLLAGCILDMWKKETGSNMSVLIEGTICITSCNGKMTVIQLSDQYPGLADHENMTPTDFSNFKYNSFDQAEESGILSSNETSYDLTEDKSYNKTYKKDINNNDTEDVDEDEMLDVVGAATNDEMTNDEVTNDEIKYDDVFRDNAQDNIKKCLLTSHMNNFLSSHLATKTTPPSSPDSRKSLPSSSTAPSPSSPSPSSPTFSSNASAPDVIADNISHKVHQFPISHWPIKKEYFDKANEKHDTIKHPYVTATSTTASTFLEVHPNVMINSPPLLSPFIPAAHTSSLSTYMKLNMLAAHNNAVKEFANRSFSVPVFSSAEERPFDLLDSNNNKINSQKQPHTAPVTGSTEQKIYKCSFCHKTFLFKSKYHEHLPVHTSERPFQCHLCTRTYKYKYDLRVHLRTHLGIPTKSTTCPFCCSKFNTNKQLRQHIRDAHNEQQRISDEQCAQSLLMAQSLA